MEMDKHKDYHRAYRVANKEYYDEYNKNYRLTHREEIKKNVKRLLNKPWTCDKCNKEMFVRNRYYHRKVLCPQKEMFNEFIEMTNDLILEKVCNYA